MLATLVIVSVLAVVFASAAIFFGKELLQKFRLLDEFVEASGPKTVRTFYWPGSNKPGMKTIAVRGDHPFTMLVGVKVGALGKTRIDPLGVVKSSSICVAAFRTYLGHGEATFVFVSSTHHEKGLDAGLDEMFIPSKTFPPHWYQRWGPLS